MSGSSEILRLTHGKGPLKRRLAALKLRTEMVSDDETSASEYYYYAAVLGQDLKLGAGIPPAISI